MEYTITAEFQQGDTVKLKKRPDMGVFTISSVVVYLHENPKVYYNLRQDLFEDEYEFYILKHQVAENLEPCDPEITEGFDINTNLFNF